MPSLPICSRNQVSLLRHIDQHAVTLPMLRSFRDPTLWSLLKRGYIARTGRGSDMVIVLTGAGLGALTAYDSNQAPMRRASNDLTERTEALLQAARLRAQNGSK